MKQNDSKRLKVTLQSFGSYLSGMVMPNMGAFIAWGLITALFIPTGWFPNEQLAELVEPMVNYLLPLLVGFTGGKMFYDVRGGTVGAVATMGVIVGSDVPMFLGAMVMGSIGGCLIKKFDLLVEGKIKSGFEMIVNNFSSGILGAILATVALVAVNPIITAITSALATGVQMIMDAQLLPLANILIEPGKVLFLNNAINHGILSPIGIEQVSEFGSSILFLLEANPGPGLGILLAFTLFGKGTAKSTAPGAIIIHFIGGIHEIYFPYILMKPSLIFATIAGGVAGSFTFNVLDAGLVAAASPGSILVFLAMTPRGGYFAVYAGILIATATSFTISMLNFKSSNSTTEMVDLKEREIQVTNQLASQKLEPGKVNKKEVKKIVFACDAGMGSSAMGASIFRKKVKNAGLEIEVINVAIHNLPKDADVVITHKDLTDRAIANVVNATHISVDNFLNSPKYDEFIKFLQ